MGQIRELNFEFLEGIKLNNYRDWFIKNKSFYEEHQQNMLSFAGDVLKRLNKHDKIDTLSKKKSVIRVYRDVRFSKDKSPFKTYAGISFKRATKLLRGGYYIHIEPGNNFVGGGFWGPNKEDLFAIRKALETEEQWFRSVFDSEEIKSFFGEVKGDMLKTCPKGFDKTSPVIDLLRYKQYLLIKEFSDQDVLSENFIEEIDKVFKAMRPFLDIMSYILTTDKNGVPKYE
jgi:uncharacterized protein (TIGR02453 family)